MDHVAGSKKWKRFTASKYGSDYAVVIPTKCEFGFKVHPCTGIGCLEAIVSSDCQATLQSYALVSKVCALPKVVKHGLEAIRDAALCEPEAES